jgi:hypothetical protein
MFENLGRMCNIDELSCPTASQRAEHLNRVGHQATSARWRIDTNRSPGWIANDLVIPKPAGTLRVGIAYTPMSTRPPEPKANP